MAKLLGIPSSKPKAEGRQLILYGPPFSGKTSTLAGSPELKILYGDMDHNTSPLDTSDHIDVYPINDYADYTNFKESVRRGYFEIEGNKIDATQYDLIVLDSFTRFEEIVKHWVANVFAPNRSREIKGKFGAQTDWDDLQRTEVEEIRDWQAMTRSHGFSTLWIGHDMNVNNEMTKQLERIQLALQGKYASPRIMSAVDGIFYLHKYTNDKGDVKRAVYTEQFGAVQAEARLPIEKRKDLPKAIPVEKLQWSKILPYLGATLKNSK